MSNATKDSLALLNVTVKACSYIAHLVTLKKCQ